MEVNHQHIADLAPEDVADAPPAADDEPEEPEAAAEPVEAPEAAPKAHKASKAAKEEPDARKVRMNRLLKKGRPEVRAALLRGGSTNTPLEGPASPFRPQIRQDA